jgi:hypothetical protein
VTARNWRTLATAALLLATCKQSGPPSDAGAPAPQPAAVDGGSAPVPGPPASPRGPRTAAVTEIHRFRDIAALRRHPDLGGVARLVEEATRDVYGDSGFAREVQRSTGEPLRPPQMLVLERFDIGPGPQLWRLTYEAWCGRSTGGSAGYKMDQILFSSTASGFRTAVSYRPGCDESGEPEILLLDLDGDGREDAVASYASTRLGAENRIDLRVLRRTTLGFVAQPLLREGSPFQTLEVRYVPSAGGGRDLHFRTFRENASACTFFEVTVVYANDRAKGVHVRGKEHLRPVPPRVLIDEGEDIDPRCAP